MGSAGPPKNPQERTSVRTAARGSDLGSPLYFQLYMGTIALKHSLDHCSRKLLPSCTQIAWGCSLGFFPQECCAEVEDGYREAGLQSPGMPPSDQPVFTTK